MNFDAKSGIESLDVMTISKVAAEQRKGRAGRTRRGTCVRLYAREQVGVLCCAVLACVTDRSCR
jgi:HrpA-like RNA helicase